MRGEAKEAAGADEPSAVDDAVPGGIAAVPGAETPEADARMSTPAGPSSDGAAYRDGAVEPARDGAPAGEPARAGQPRPAPPAGVEALLESETPAGEPAAPWAATLAGRDAPRLSERRPGPPAPRLDVDRDETTSPGVASPHREAVPPGIAPVRLFPRGSAVDDGPRQDPGPLPDAPEKGHHLDAARRRPSGERPDPPDGVARHGGGSVPGAEGSAAEPADRAAPLADAGVDGSALVGTLMAIAGQDWSGAAGTIIPCAVFNAAMIPGWPPPRPFDLPEVGAVAARAMPVPRDEEAVLARFAERGGALLGQQLRGLLKRTSARRKRRMLAALAAVMDTIDAVLTAVEAELLLAARNHAAESDDLAADDLRRQLTA